VAGSRRHQVLGPWDAVQQDLCSLRANQAILFGSQYQRGYIDAAEYLAVVGIPDRSNAIHVGLVRCLSHEEPAGSGRGPRYLALGIES
jgi:hypothetical protein